MTPLVLFALLASTPDPVLGLTVEVLNPGAFGGHRILHLEDLVGPKRRTDIPNLPKPRAVVIFTVEPEGCVQRHNGWCGWVDAWMDEAWSKEGLVLGLVLATRDTEAELRKAIPYAGFRFPVALDIHRVGRQALKSVRPGEFVVVQSTGENTKLVPPSNLVDESARRRFMKEVTRAFEEAIRRDKEAEE